MDIPSMTSLATSYCEAITNISPIKTDRIFLIGEDSGLGMELDQTSPKQQIVFSERRKASEKRPAEDLEPPGRPTQFKRHRSFDVGRNKSYQRHFATSDIRYDAASICTDEESDVIQDNTNSNILPTIEGKHSDLSTISADTMQKVLCGDYADVVDSVTVIDCRYPYEYQAGHIMNAINLYTNEGISQFLTENTPTSSKHVLIFHCEFSSKRGPKLCRFLRNQDRQMNGDNYPKLNFPEIYLLEGGYKQFYETYKDLCFPQAYKPMLDKQHSADLRHFRVKSKSWAAGDKPQYKTGLQRLRLSFN